MTETTTAETPTTPKPKAARTSKPAPAPKPSAATSASPPRTKHVIVQPLPRGTVIDPAAIITVNVAANPKLEGCKAWQRWEAGYTTGRSVKETLGVPGGPTIGDLRYDFERGFIDIVPAPAIPPKK